MPCEGPWWLFWQSRSFLFAGSFLHVFPTWVVVRSFSFCRSRWPACEVFGSFAALFLLYLFLRSAHLFRHWRPACIPYGPSGLQPPSLVCRYPCKSFPSLYALFFLGPSTLGLGTGHDLVLGRTVSSLLLASSLLINLFGKIYFLIEDSQLLPLDPQGFFFPAEVSL